MTAFADGSRQFADALLFAHASLGSGDDGLAALRTAYLGRGEEIGRRALAALTPRQRKSLPAREAALAAGRVVVEEYQQVLAEALSMAAGLVQVIMDETDIEPAEALRRAVPNDAGGR